jgi:SAM-dependent methyltransferase
MPKLKYLKRILKHRITGQPRACPHCGERSALPLLGRKKLVQEVRQCRNCLLIFRWPCDTPEESESYYESVYASGAVTDLPSESELAKLLQDGFRGGPLDFSEKIAALKTLQASGRVLDYGCSWGYGVFQLLRQGYDAIGYEVSKGRARYGREHLRVPVLDSPGELDRLGGGSFDAIFSNHVIEHLPAVGDTLRAFARLLDNQGLAFLILPNFTGRAARAGAFWNWIGETHPIAPTADFFRRNLPAYGFDPVLCASGPFAAELLGHLRARRWNALDTEGDELLVMAWKKAGPQTDAADSSSTSRGAQ